MFTSRAFKIAMVAGGTITGVTAVYCAAIVNMIIINGAMGGLCVWSPPFCKVVSKTRIGNTIITTTDRQDGSTSRANVHTITRVNPDDDTK